MCLLLLAQETEWGHSKPNVSNRSSDRITLLFQNSKIKVPVASKSSCANYLCQQCNNTGLPKSHNQHNAWTY